MRFKVCGSQPEVILRHLSFVFFFCDQEPIPGTPVALSELEGEEGEQDDGKTPSIEREHVQAVYDTIAPHW